MWEKELEKAKQLSVSAGREIVKIYNDPDNWNVEYKKDSSPLTKADKAANRIITEGLKESFPNYAILSEEEKDDRARLLNDHCFIVDPLDGTKEFIKRNGQFTVNIALSYRHRVVLGVIYVPVTRELYYAAKGNGAFKCTVKEENEYPDFENMSDAKQLHVSEETTKSRLRAVGSSSHGSPELAELLNRFGITDLVKIGSSLKGCLVAEGKAEIYYRHNPTMEWDTAAMQCIAEEAGAVFRQMDGSEMLYNREDSRNDKGFYVINSLENELH